MRAKKKKENDLENEAKVKELKSIGEHKFSVQVENIFNQWLCLYFIHTPIYGFLYICKYIIIYDANTSIRYQSSTSSSGFT